MIIDFHTHNFPDALAPKAVAALTRQLNGAFPPVADGTVAAQLRDMSASGVDRAVVCPIATKPAQFDVILRRSCAVRDGAEGEEAARRLTFLASIHPLDPDYAARAKALGAAGIAGAVIHPYYQGVSLDDPRVWPLFAALRDAGLFAMSHCGNDAGYPNAPLCCGPAQIARLLKAVPGLTFVACHLGGFDGSAAHATDALLEFPSCYIDTARIANQDGNPEADRILATWPADRLLFGTDYFWRNEKELADWVRRTRTDPREQALIFQENAERLLSGGRL